MKIFIDTIKWVILKEEKESPFFEGENFASKLRIYVNDNGDSYPTLSLLKANGRKRGPFNYDASGYGTEVVDGIEWNYYEFTLSTINGALDVPGQLLMTCIINTNGSQRAFNFTNNVVKTAIDYDNGIVVYGDDPTDIINDIGKNLDTYQKSVDEHNKAINNINSELNDKVSLETLERRDEELSENLEKKYILRSEGVFKNTLIQYLDEDAPDSRKYATKEELPTKTSQLENDADYIDSERLTDVVDSLEAQIKRNGGKNYYLSGYTSSNGIRELATTLYDYDEEFQSTNVGKFYVELGDGTIIENLYLKRFSGTQGVNYYLNSVIRENNTIKVYLGTLPRTKMTISDFINKHNQIATMQDIANLVNSAPETLDTLGELAAAINNHEDSYDALLEVVGNKANKTEIPTKVSQLENDSKFVTEEFVEEKVANAGSTNIPTDLLDRVQELETLSEEAVYMEDTEFDVEEETGGSVGGGTVDLSKYTLKKQYNEITTPIFNASEYSIEKYFYEGDLSDKYTVIDLSNIEQLILNYQDASVKFYIEETIFNATLFIKIPINVRNRNFVFYLQNLYTVCIDPQSQDISLEGERYENSVKYAALWVSESELQKTYIKIDFDDYGFATVYAFEEFEC